MSEEFSTNLSSNGSNCSGHYCVESNLYIKIMGTIIFLLVWPFIVLDIKWLPLGRPAAALMGGVLMVVFAVVPQDQVYAILGGTGNLQTLFLLIGMMMLSYYYDREGMLQHIALWIFGKNKPFKYVLWKVCVLSAVLSAIITNDATCLVLTPLLLIEHTKQNRPKYEYPPLLLGIATSANIGSSSTFFGNPQNAFIAANSRGQISLIVFFITTLPAAIIGMFISVALLYLCYFRVIWPKRDILMESTDINGKPNVVSGPGEDNGESKNLTFSKHGSGQFTENGLISSGREELALSCDKSGDPYMTSKMSQERSKLYTPSKDSSLVVKNASSPQPGNEETTTTTSSSSSTSTSSSTLESNCNTQEYGAIDNNYFDNHINNYIASGRLSRLQLRSSDRFGSSMRMSQTLTKAVSGDSTNLEQTSDEPKESVDSSKYSKFRKRFFVGWLIFITCVLIALLAIPPPPTIPVGFNLGLVPMSAGILTMLVDTIVNRKYAFDVMMKVDWTMILMFMGLFIWLGGFENTLFPTNAFKFLRSYMDLYTVEGVLLFTMFVVVGSNVLSNVPLVILIMDQLFSFKCGPDNYCTGQLTGVLLAGISTIAGNFTLIGSVANLIVAEKARNITNYRLGFWEYLRFGFFSTLMVLITGIPIMYFAGDGVKI